MTKVATGTTIRETKSNGIAFQGKKGKEGVAFTTTEERVASVPADVEALRAQLEETQRQLREARTGGQTVAPEAVRTHTSGMGVMVPSHQADVKSFGQFSDAEKDGMKNKALVMERAGRLFIQRSPDAGLERAKAFDLYNSLEYGAGGLVYVVDKYGDHSEGRSSASSSTWDKEGFRSNWHASSSSSSGSGSTAADYGSSPLLNWSSFKDWTSESGQGLPGVTNLASPDGSVSTGAWSKWESQSRSSAHEYHIFRPDEHRNRYDSSSYWSN